MGNFHRCLCKEKWKSGVATAASCDNIRWKISGLGMGDNNWTVDSIRRYVLTSIETVGVDRCFFATNWPVDWLWSTYDKVVDAYKEIISGFSRGRAGRVVFPRPLRSCTASDEGRRGV